MLSPTSTAPTMQHTFGTVSIDTTPPGRESGPYLFFACSATGVNGEIWGSTAERATTVLREMSAELAESVLRASGDLVGGCATSRFESIMSMNPALGLSGRLRFPGRLEERDGDGVFVDAADRPLAIHSRSLWRHQFSDRTGVPLGRTRDFACGGEADSPAFYGTEREGVAQVHVVAYTVSAVPPASQLTAEAAPVRRRAAPR